MIKKLLYISILTLLCGGGAMAEKAKKGSVDGVKDIDSTVYAYYKECSRSIGEPRIMQMADTLYMMARNTDDSRTMCAAMCFKQEHWIAHENADSARHYMEIVQRMAQEYDKPLYYYYTWGRYVECLLTMHLYNTALGELQKMKGEVEKSEHCMVNYLQLMVKFFSYERNYLMAYEYSKKLIDYVEEKGFDDFNHHVHYVTLVDNLARLGRNEEALEWLQRAYRTTSKRKSQKLALYAEEVKVRLGMKDYRNARRALIYVNGYEPEGYAIKEVVEPNVAYYTAVKDYETALRWITRFHEQTGLGDLFLRERCEILSHIPGREKEAAQMAMRYIEQCDSLAVAEQNASIVEFASAMELTQLENKISTMKLHTSQTITAISLAALFILILFTIYLALTRKRLTDSIKSEAMVTIKKDKLENELLVARELQENMLHQAHTQDPRIELSADLCQALQVSGDLYDYQIEDNKLHFIIADISGKGLGASLYMTVTTCTFRTVTRWAQSPADTLQSINQLICANNPGDIFITALVGTLDLESGDLKLCSAGHNLPFLLSRDLSGQHHLAHTLLLESNMPLGVNPDQTFVPQRTVLNPGDTLFVYTDGITEAANPQEELYGEERLKQTLLANATNSTRQMLDNCLKQVNDYTEDSPLMDDITMIAIRYNGNEK